MPAHLEVHNYQSLRGAVVEGPNPGEFVERADATLEAISDLDRFFEHIYRYYCDKGLFCIVVQWIAELFTLGFTMVFSGFLLLFVNWNGLLHCGSGGNPCDLRKEGFYDHPLHPLSIFKAIVVIYLTLFSTYWVICFLRFFAQLRETLVIRKFCHKRLRVGERELQTTSWPKLVERMVELQTSHRLCVASKLSAHDIVGRIMRKENYLIGLLNKGVIALPVPHWLPGAGPFVGYDELGNKKRLILTKTLEWSLNWCVLQHMFDRNFMIRRDFISNPDRLKIRLMALGFFMLILSPFYTIFMLIYFFLQNAEQFYHQPSTAGSRQWSNLAKWTFREFNELDHLLKYRLNLSYKHAVEYVKQFPSPIVSVMAKFVSFVAGAFAAVLLGIALIDESLLQAPLYGHDLVWYVAICGGVLAVSRSLIPEEFQVFDLSGEIQGLAQHTHYVPKHWRGAENTESVQAEFKKFFQLQGMVFLEEMASIFITPFILWFFLPKCVDGILQFVAEFTVNVEGVGHVCSLSVFDFERHGNSKYGSPFHISKDRRSSQGKMEKSFLSFKANYASWEPDERGKQFLSLLANYQAQEQAAAAGQSVAPQLFMHGAFDALHKMSSSSRSA